jgi:hypothetical protein
MTATGGTMTETKNEISSSDCISITGEAPSKKGNLHSMLSTYEENAGDGASLEDMDTGGPSDISFSLDAALGRERSSTLGSFRDRGLTFDSEFDLGLGFGDATAAQESQEGVGVQVGGVIEFADDGNPQQPSQRLNIVSANSSNASTNNRVTTTVEFHQSQFQPQGQIQMQLPQNSSGQQIANPNITGASQSSNADQGRNVKIETSSFFSGMFGGANVEPIISATAGAPNPVFSGVILLVLMGGILLFGLLPKVGKWVPTQSVVGFLLVLSTMIIIPENLPILLKDPVTGAVAAGVTAAAIDPFLGMLVAVLVRAFIGMAG